MVKSFLRLSKEDRIFKIAAYSILIIAFFIVTLPLINFVSISVSSAKYVASGSVMFLPKGITLLAYRYVLGNSQFYQSFIVSVSITVIGTLTGVLIAVSVAYPLSKRKLPGRKLVTILFVATMLFDVGIIPNYLLVRNLGLLNTIWALILPQVVIVFNFLVVKSFMESIPDEIEESAKIDGASYLTILFRIIIPIAMPVLATITLFYAVFYWNDYFNARFYITMPSLMPIQLYLRTVIFEARDPTGSFSLSNESLLGIDVQTVINATVVLAVIPILVVYPFVQRFFIKGLTIGSVKG